MLGWQLVAGLTIARQVPLWAMLLRERIKQPIQSMMVALMAKAEILASAF